MGCSQKQKIRIELKNRMAKTEKKDRTKEQDGNKEKRTIELKNRMVKTEKKDRT
jgi:hypothetical protein